MKTLQIVVITPSEIDKSEIARIRAVVSELTGEELDPIAPAGSSMVFLAHAEYGLLRDELNKAKAMTTQMFIATLSKPCTTVGFGRSVAPKLRKHLGSE